MKKEQLHKILAFLKNAWIEKMEDRFYDFKKRNQDSLNYCILKAETTEYNQVDNVDLMTVEVYIQEIEWPWAARDVWNEIIEKLRWDWVDFDWFRAYQVLPTWALPEFTLKWQFKFTCFFQVRYLI